MYKAVTFHSSILIFQWFLFIIKVKDRNSVAIVNQFLVLRVGFYLLCVAQIDVDTTGQRQTVMYSGFRIILTLGSEKSNRTIDTATWQKFELELLVAIKDFQA